MKWQEGKRNDMENGEMKCKNRRSNDRSNNRNGINR